MTRLYLNGRLCNGSGRGKDEYSLAELKQIAKDNSVFVFSVSTKEDICKELIKHNKKTKQPIVISPKIANTPKSISVEPVIVKTKKVSKTPVDDTNKKLVAAKKEAEKARIQLEDAESKYLAELENLKILDFRRDEALAMAAFTKDKRTRALGIAKDKAIEKSKLKTIEKAKKAKAKFEEAKQIAIEKFTELEKAMGVYVSNTKSSKATSTTSTTSTSKANSTVKAAPKPREPKSDCIKLNSKKYTERPSPPYSANECRDKILLGNDGYQYISKPSSNGVYRWAKV